MSSIKGSIIGSGNGSGGGIQTEIDPFFRENLESLATEEELATALANRVTITQMNTAIADALTSYVPQSVFNLLQTQVSNLNSDYQITKADGVYKVTIANFPVDLEAFSISITGFRVFDARVEDQNGNYIIVEQNTANNALQVVRRNGNFLNCTITALMEIV